MTVGARQKESVLGPVEVTVWTIEPNADDRFDAWVSTGERVKAAGFAGDGRSLEFLAGRALARAALARTLGVDAPDVPIEVDPAGRPVVTAAPGAGDTPWFSIAHCRGLVACAVASVPVGVDAERDDRIPDAAAFAGSHFRPQEAARIRRSAVPPLSAVRLWTLKEAFSKAVGLGLRLPLDATAFDLFETERPVVTVVPPAYGPTTDWRCAVADRGGAVVLSVVARTTGRPLSLRLRAARGSLIDPPRGRARRTGP
jgi:4'-phosphopantetheinyl transferase